MLSSSGGSGAPLSIRAVVVAPEASTPSETAVQQAQKQNEAPAVVPQGSSGDGGGAEPPAPPAAWPAQQPSNPTPFLECVSPAQPSNLTPFLERVPDATLPSTELAKMVFNATQAPGRGSATEAAGSIAAVLNAENTMDPGGWVGTQAFTFPRGAVPHHRPTLWMQACGHSP